MVSEMSGLISKLTGVGLYLSAVLEQLKHHVLFTLGYWDGGAPFQQQGAAIGFAVINFYLTGIYQHGVVCSEETIGRQQFFI